MKKMLVQIKKNSSSGRLYTYFSKKYDLEAGDWVELIKIK